MLSCLRIPFHHKIIFYKLCNVLLWLWVKKKDNWFVIQIWNWLVKYSETRQIPKDFTALNKTNTRNIVYKEKFLLDIGEDKLGPWHKFEIDVLNYYCDLVIIVHCLSLHGEERCYPLPSLGDGTESLIRSLTWPMCQDGLAIILFAVLWQAQLCSLLWGRCLLSVPR